MQKRIKRILLDKRAIIFKCQGLCFFEIGIPKSILFFIYTLFQNSHECVFEQLRFKIEI